VCPVVGFFWSLHVLRANTGSVVESAESLKTLDNLPRTELRRLLMVELQRGSNVSQRSLARRLGVAVGTVNRILNELAAAGYVDVFDRGVRPFAYRLTGEGERYQRQLSLEQYSTALHSLRRHEERIRAVLHGVKDRGMRRVVFYGAGEVMDATCRVAREVGLEVIGAVDDDPTKQKVQRSGIVIGSPQAINHLKPDAVLITTFRHAEEIQLKIDPGLRETVQVLEL